MRRFFVFAALALTLAPVSGRQPLRLDQMDNQYNALIDGWYRRYLRRPAESFRTDAVSMLKSGTAQETILAGILASPEYYTNAGGNDSRYVARLIADVTGRPANAREMGYLLGRLRREDRGQAVYEFLAIHPEGLRISQFRPEPAHEFRRTYHRDYDHDRWDERKDRRDR